MSMHTYASVFPYDRVVVLRQCLVRICDGNHCAALILNDLYDQESQYQGFLRMGHREESNGPSLFNVGEMTEDMSGLFTREQVVAAFFFLQEKGYVQIFPHYDLLYYYVNLPAVNEALRLLREQDEQARSDPPDDDPFAYEREQRIQQAALEAKQERETFEALPREERPFFRVPRPEREQRERVKIQAALRKDRSNGLPATLTFDQWIQTLDDFQWHCAYCYTGRYEVLEHFIPRRHRGGTTVSNCLPACESCNTRKYNHHPSTLLNHKELGPAIERLQAYLESRGQEVEQ